MTRTNKRTNKRKSLNGSQRRRLHSSRTSGGARGISHNVFAGNAKFEDRKGLNLNLAVSKLADQLNKGETTAVGASVQRMAPNVAKFMLLAALGTVAAIGAKNSIASSLEAAEAKGLASDASCRSMGFPGGMNHYTGLCKAVPGGLGDDYRHSIATKGHRGPFDRQIGPPDTAEIFTTPSRFSRRRENPSDAPRIPYDYDSDVSDVSDDDE